MSVTAKPYKFTQEHELLTKQAEIDQFWQSGEFSSFKSYDQLNIHYALFTKAKHKQCIVLSSGRSESYLKYKELAFDLQNNGYNVAMIDHRGQGLSQRELEDNDKGYVDDFNDYVIDMHQWLNTYVMPECGDNMYLLAHSMGGTIATLYAQQFSSAFKAVVLSSPMIAVNGGSIPDWLGKPLIKTSHFVDNLFGDQSAYFFGHGPYQSKPFKGNDLMQSQIRYQHFNQLYQQTPEIQLGGVTLAWLNGAVKAEAQIFANIDKITTPLLVLQAARDTVVSNEKQTQFCQQLHQLQPASCPDGKPVVIENALHELLFEQDEIRNQALRQTLNWFAEQQ
ncbi:alpha/beta fold hydrolase [Thalassotalea sp. ND16A]|uniref:alpha/beta fold hydrolase n=1 Tax=Thalassotalea sp. ND16A TaxID=1535422 RepID=UPI000A684CF0|nr:alpha/beta fold hydrolase [Thalassotalea sp. ND16A]